MTGCVALVVGFGSSDEARRRLRPLGGIGTMTATTIGFFFVLWEGWNTPLAFAACARRRHVHRDRSHVPRCERLKLADGGWVPLSVAGAVFALAMIWYWGRRTLSRRIAARTTPVEAFLDRSDVRSAHRVSGTAVFLTASTDGVPPIVDHFERNAVLHEQIVLLTIQMLDIPFVEPKRRLAETELGGGFFRVVARFGYSETANVPAILEACAIMGMVCDFERITYVVGRDALRLRHEHGPLSIPRRIFAFLSRNQATTLSYFSMPVSVHIEIGMQLEL